jgi:hypothetical protein
MSSEVADVTDDRLIIAAPSIASLEYWPTAVRTELAYNAIGVPAPAPQGGRQAIEVRRRRTDEIDMRCRSSVDCLAR